ncbi:MAG TPA: sigma factor [Thermoleophilia bacterium]|nr:sigma factor [Thermoleophilia bacterium]
MKPDATTVNVWNTRWTEILAARTLDPERRRKAVGRVMARYWRPVYAYLRARGKAHEDAEDLIQGFFVKVIERGLIQQADPAKGRFRTFLLTALDWYARDERVTQTAQKRRPPGGIASLEAFEVPPPIPTPEAGPEQAFTYAWVSEVLDDVLAEVQAQCRQARQGAHWEVFRRTVLEPTVWGAEPPAMAQLCRELGILTPKQAAAMNVTVKRRFQRVMRAHVRQFVASEDEVDAEIRDLMAILAKGRVRK